MPDPFSSSFRKHPRTRVTGQTISLQGQNVKSHACLLQLVLFRAKSPTGFDLVPNIAFRRTSLSTYCTCLSSMGPIKVPQFVPTPGPPNTLVSLEERSRTCAGEGGWGGHLDCEGSRDPAPRTGFRGGYIHLTQRAFTRNSLVLQEVSNRFFCAVNPLPVPIIYDLKWATMARS